MSQQKQMLVQPLVEELFNMVIREGYMHSNEDTRTAQAPISPQFARLLEKLHGKSF